ncbi:heme o synthase [Alicyclobacillus vulcanalis]|uniref:Protoheme IX farnesyltransferase n=2 Tax=Alicyclobacillus TaxID=29330 RepID=A0A1N7K0S2_9BACL|nr:heme o synthase [Alicyclobacillus vulcanalis]SIS55193.1 protoheme IX farnesyltransferase [Alicyclobacillus vulcanalis]
MLTANGQETVRPNERTCYPSLRALWELGKPRINALLLFSAFCAMVAARHGLPPLRPALVGLLGLGLACAGAAMVNMWFDRDIDRLMDRTRDRPLPQGQVAPSTALVTGLILGLSGFAVLDIAVGGLAAWLTVAGYLYYAGIYTMWLKRRTPQNIVIGGGSGAIPPLVGWAAVTGHLAPLAWLLFLIVFLWTPSHFWGLALYRSKDYRRASVPMMPVVRGAKTTIAQMLFYALALAGVDLAVSHFVLHPELYLAVAGLLNAWFVAVHIRLALSRSEITAWAKRTFLASLVYLPVALLGVAVANV